MSNSTLINEYFKIADKLIHDAGKVLLEADNFDDIECKTSQSDLVTIYDRKVEQIIIETLRTKYPNHKFIGEESVNDHNLTINLTDEPTWIIDPIDGTLNFVHNFPFHCISLALAINRQIEIGIVYNPQHHEFFSAKRNQGAFLNGKKLSCSKVQDIKKALICSETFLCRVHKKHEFRFNKLLSLCQGIRSLGSTALSLCYVASGSLDAFEIDYAQPWDVAAGALIIEEAGGIIKNISGGPIDLLKPACVAAGTNTLADTVIEICKQSNKIV